VRHAWRWTRELREPRLWQGALSLAGFFAIWQILGSLHLGGLKEIPAPTELARTLAETVRTSRYWLSWLVSAERVALGFLAGTVIGVPLGLALGISRTFHGITFPVVEILRPVPPLAWVPISILFWPTRELSIIFVIFLGEFFTVVLNVLGGVQAIDPSLRRAALSMGARPRHIFWKIVLPAATPAIFTGMALGMGLTWEIVVAAEMIAGKSGLGYLTWEGFVNGSMTAILAAMLSIGVAGFLSSVIIWVLGRWATPWQRLFQ
jgi:NitT/TauT family transport system permease protein